MITNWNDWGEQSSRCVHNMCHTQGGHFPHELLPTMASLVNRGAHAYNTRVSMIGHICWSTIIQSRGQCTIILNEKSALSKTTWHCGSVTIVHSTVSANGLYNITNTRACTVRWETWQNVDTKSIKAGIHIHSVCVLCELEHKLLKSHLCTEYCQGFKDRS